MTTRCIFHLDSTDYMRGSFDKLIPAGTVKVTHSVITLRDNFVEEDEYFKATLSLPGGPEDMVLLGSQDVAFVTITDSTGVCLFCYMHGYMHLSILIAAIILVYTLQ